MNQRLIDSLTHLFRDTPRDAMKREPFACLVVFDRTQYQGDPVDCIGQAMTLAEHHSTPHIIKTFPPTVGCTLEGAEGDTYERLLGIQIDPKLPQYLRDRAYRAGERFLKRRYKPTIAPHVHYDAARHPQSLFGEGLFFVGVTHRSPALQRFVEAAHRAWALCASEPFAEQAGVTRQDLVFREDVEGFVRWTALVFRSLHKTGKLQSDSPVAGAALYWFQDDVFAASLAAIAALATPTPAERIAKPPPANKKQLKKRITVEEANKVMLEAMQANHDRLKWSAREWAKHVRCSTSTIHKTETWTQCEVARNKAKLERMSRNCGRRKPRHRSQA